MRRPRPFRRWHRAALAGCALTGVFTLGAPVPAASQPEAADEPTRAPDYSDRPQTCEGCHELAKDDYLEFDDGTRISLYVDPSVHARSIHGDDGAELVCTDCHRWVARYPHLQVHYEDRRAFSAAKSKACYRCHFKYAASYLDGVHFAKLRRERSGLDVEAFQKKLLEDDEDAQETLTALTEQPDKHAPVCSDCHGSHDVNKAGEPRGRISQMCRDCHEDVVETYAESAHGRSVEEGIEDVPVCADCHGSHAIEKTQTEAFHAGSYQICARCHGDKAKMEKYDLNPNVLDTYLDDFHGSSNFLYTSVGHIPAEPIATCGDCHGYHDVQEFDETESVAAVRARVAEMCAECHEGATESFADAWLSHSSPTLSRTPLVWIVTWGYRILIPFMLVGLLLHIAMHLMRAAFGPGGQGESSR